ncbi:A/G-specific adenine glycosylase [Crocinitomicaceae bacterium]|jgi:A/G-specific adenine glycosylase|nr:A/G-specific adenine glycosylase [Crocinitomicaceae bacterium]MDG1347506.1 A/G-specific adenine glycosylase [Crocinitomicaceae bacterium]
MSENINVLIINWYDENKRDLPWRRTDNPYFIWLSEIILQQTRVQQGLSYYEKFIHHYPTISDLANAKEQEVLNDWQGLGYYSRARNLHKAAKIVHNERKGEFPKTYKDIINLPGIGDYTASAISSFAFFEPQAVLDGNVFRVLSRLFNIVTPIDSTLGKKEFRTLAQAFLFSENPASHNQAMMEFGATLCTPKIPNCGNCPVRIHCEAYKVKTHLELPVKSKKTKVRERNMKFLLCSSGGHFLVEKRLNKDIWQHLYQLPLIDEETLKEREIQPKFEEKIGSPIFDFTKQEEITHLLSHQKLTLEFYTAKYSSSKNSENFELISIAQITDHPFPRPLIDFLNKTFHLQE